MPHIIFEGRDIQYTMETKVLGIYINENMKWNNYIKYLSLKLNRSYYMINFLKGVTRPYILRSVYSYFAHFYVRLRYGLTLRGGDPESERIFKFAKKKKKLLVMWAKMFLIGIFLEILIYSSCHVYIYVKLYVI